MNYKEKLKAIINSNKTPLVDIDTFLKYFPELKESNGERIWIINYLSNRILNSTIIAEKENLKKAIAWLENQGEQKPNYCHHEVDLSGCSEEYRKAYYDGWNNCNQQHEQLKAEQKPSEWSKEDAMQLDAAIHIVANSGHTCTSDWLKALKERVQLQNGYNPYKEVVESIAEMCKHYDTASHSGLRDFYDNVRVKCKDAKEYDYLYPQNTWNPSALQIECLSDAIKHYNSQGYTAPVLKELLEQLKKLREE